MRRRGRQAAHAEAERLGQEIVPRERWVEVVPAEHPHPRAVVYLYSQTGQLREVADALTAPLVARGWNIRWVDVEPRVARLLTAMLEGMRA